MEWQSYHDATKLVQELGGEGEGVGVGGEGGDGGGLGDDPQAFSKLPSKFKRYVHMYVGISIWMKSYKISTTHLSDTNFLRHCNAWPIRFCYK